MCFGQYSVYNAGFIWIFVYSKSKYETRPIKRRATSNSSTFFGATLYKHPMIVRHIVLNAFWLWFIWHSFIVCPSVRPRALQSPLHSTLNATHSHPRRVATTLYFLKLRESENSQTHKQSYYLFTNLRLERAAQFQNAQQLNSDGLRVNKCVRK